MENLLLNKYKDRSPKDTVALVTEFFEKKGFKIKRQVFETEIGTWTCRIEIFMNGLEILGANGKGVTEDFALASGYSELFERFCNRNNYINNPFFNRKAKELRPEYLYDKDEKILDPFTMISGVKILEDYYRDMLKTDEAIKEFFEIHYPEGARGVSFKHIGVDQELYLDPSIMLRVTGSNGMAAGNSEKEALNQGMSELYERRGSVLFYAEPQSYYRAVDLSTITNEKYKHAVDTMLNDDFDFVVLDLSYNFGIPVLAGILIDKIGLSCHINFSAFPVFDIAFERILTEIYQGIDCMRRYCGTIQIPSKGNRASYILNAYGNNYTEAAYISDELIRDKLEYFSYSELSDNSKVFLPAQDKNNENIYNYYIQLSKSLGYDFYYHNFSLIDEMAAVYIIAPEMLSIEQIRRKNNQFASPLIVQGVNTYAKALLDLIDKTCELANNYNNLDFQKDLIDKWNIFSQLSSEEGILQHYGDLSLCGMETPVPDMTSGYSAILSPMMLLNGNTMGRIMVNEKSYLYPYQKLYATVLAYKSQLYTTEEIQEVFKSLFNVEVNYDQIDEMPQVIPTLLDCYFYPTTALYNSDIYDNIVKAYIERG